MYKIVNTAAVLFMVIAATLSSPSSPSSLLQSCTPLPPHIPSSIHDLRPDDIKVVMTLGDSITAGFGLEGAKGTGNEYRGQSWSIGADDNATTMYNFLRFFSPDVVGGSLGYHVVEICIDPYCQNPYIPQLDVLNSAQSGAQVDDLADKELVYLLKQLSALKIDMENDWKLLTLFIGANDLCGTCFAPDPYHEPDRFESGIFSVLENVRQNIPKTFVNIVQMFNLSGVYLLGLDTLYCTEMHQHVSGFECSCMMGDQATDATRNLTDFITQEVNSRMSKIASYYQTQNYSDFTVVVQPFARDTQVSSLPTDFLSTLDCFHPSRYAHQTMAVSLWNNMLTPEAQKKTQINPSDVPICPDATTYLYTN